MPKKSNESQKLAEVCAAGMLEKKAKDVVIMDLRKLDSSMTDFFVIGHGTSDRQVQAIAESVEEEVRKNLNEKPWHTEGKETAEWILMDYVNVIVHVFLSEKREFFGLEELWGDAVIKSYEDEVV
jgi:ribosome-associated protein